MKANESAGQYNTQEEKEIEDQRQEIEDEFRKLYEKDPELRDALAKQDINELALEDKYSIIEAYLSEGGIKNL